MQTNSNWEDKPQVKKGDYGEMLVDKFLEKKGFICYFPKTKGAHWFDRLAIKDKKTVVVAESKTKARMNKYPATGFNYKNYLEYKRIYETHKIRVFVFFIDEWLKKIYGNFLPQLEVEKEIDGIKYPLRINNVIVFPLKNMRNIADLSDKDCAYLKKHSTRNYDYKVVGMPDTAAATFPQGFGNKSGLAGSRTP